ncbi:MAG: hypothetical protein ACQESQ_06745 [Bacteroidota bacterium]
MKKLKKLSLKQMEQEMHLLGSYEQSGVVGGYTPSTWTYQEFFNYLEGEFTSEWNAIVSSLDNAFDEAESFFESRAESFANLSWSAVEESVTTWLNNLAGGASPLGAPIIIIDNPSLYPGSGSDSYSGSDIEGSY